MPGSRGKRPSCPKDSPRQHAVDWIRASKYRSVRLGAKRATTKNQARLGWATKKESKSQRHARCCRAPPRHAPRRSRLLPVPRSCTQERALRNMNSELGSSRRTVATVFHMGWDASVREAAFDSVRQGRLVGEKKRAMRPEQRALTALERQMCLRAAENFWWRSLSRPLCRVPASCPPGGQPASRESGWGTLLGSAVL